MKRALLFLFCALISTQMFSESSSPYGTATSFAKTDVVSTTFNNDIEDISSDLRKKYLVEKITWYDDETNHKEAYYEYDNNNRLVRRIIHNTYFEQGRVKYDTIVDNYEYTEGNLTKISYKDVYVSYTYDLEYDNAGRLITSKYGNNIMHFCYRGGKMDSIWYDNDPECYTILKYDEHGNIVKEINRVPEMDDIWGEYPTGNYVFREHEYEYDDKIRPFFNIDNAFVYDPIFGQGTTHSEYIRMLSTNNLIKYSRSSWHYTYNEEGLPIELRSRFEGETPVNDPKYVFTYRKIKKTESLADLLPTLWGLQRTGCTKTIGEDEYGTVWGSRSYLMQGIGNTIIDGKQYILFGTNNIYDEYCSLWLREENNKILVYSTAQKKDLVLYDFTLNVGDLLPRLYIDFELSSVVDYYKYEAEWEYTKPLIVTEVSTITLLDGKEYKKWTFDNGMQYVEGIGSFGTSYGHNDFYQLIVNAPLYSDVYSQHLVCTSRNGQLLYQMDASEMEQLETECLCEAENPEDLFPTLWGLQRTVCNEYYEETEDDNSANNTYQQTFERIFFENDKPYILCSGYLLREEDNMILIYSQTLNKDLVLYDFTLEVGDSLLALYINAPQWDPPQSEDIIIVTPPYNGYVVDHDYNGKPDPVVVTDVSYVTLLDGKEHKKWTFNNGMEYVEGIGSFGNDQWSGDFFQLIANKGVPTSLLGEHLVCASKNGQLLYKMDESEMAQLETGCLCEAENPEDLFPTLWGLQRTVCNEYCGETEDDNSANNTYQQTFERIFFENGKPYILCSGYLLREEDNKILIYSQLLNKDLVLYDFTLEVGDSLPALYIDYQQHNAMDWMPYNIGVVDYKTDFVGTIYPADTFVVTDISNVTLLDGKEYKKWTFDNGMEYVEGIGMYGGRRNGNFFGLIREVVVPCHTGTHLVCVSKNGKLLYQMDDAEMERLGAECLCDYDRGPLKDNAKNGKIGGRPTPTQWNQLELDLREMENGNTILRAETFSYTLENESIVANGKTYYQLARQSTKDTAMTKSFVGALHFGEDEDNRVYFLRDGVEYVLYDFTAEPGDTIEIFAGINNYPQDSTYTHVVTGKDTLENGACRMLLEVVFPDETATAENAEKVWLAGLGSVDGIVHNAATRATTARSSDTQTSVMLCAWRDDNCLYTTDHPDYNTLGCVYNIDEMTSVEDTHSSLPMTDCYKLLRNGQLLIIHKGKTYNVLGVPVE